MWWAECCKSMYAAMLGRATAVPAARRWMHIVVMQLEKTYFPGGVELQ